MKRILPQIILESTRGPKEVLGALDRRGREWRESRLGSEARKARIVRWTIATSGRRARISPGFASGPWAVSLPRHFVVLECDLSAIAAGTRVSGSFRPSRPVLWWLAFFTLYQFLYPVTGIFGRAADDRTIHWAAGLESAAILLALFGVLFVAAAWTSREAYAEVLTQALGADDGGHEHPGVPAG